jgi:hypothetical protein
MTSYEPYPTVIIAGVIYMADNTLSNIKISSGRRDVLNQPEPTYSNIEFWTDANNPLPIELSDSVEININKGTLGGSTIFTGVVSDINISIPQYGATGSIAIYNVTAVGALAQLNRRFAGASGFAKEKDGTRILNILSEAFLTEWDDLDNVTTWNQIPAAVTWNNYDATSQTLVNNLIFTIDNPGVYELQAYAAQEANALELAQEAAQSGRGVLWEDGAGALHYDDYVDRAISLPFKLIAEDILTNGLSSASQLGEVANNVTIVYKNNQTKNAQDPQSRILYGQRAASKSTLLENAIDAETQANDYLFSRAYPRNYPAVITVPLHSPTVDDLTRDKLADVYNGLKIEITNLPAVFGAEFLGFVEGYEWNLTRYTADLSLFVSAYSESYQSTIWLQVPETTTWNTYNPTKIWDNA